MFNLLLDCWGWLFESLRVLRNESSLRSVLGVLLTVLLMVLIAALFAFGNTVLIGLTARIHQRIWEKVITMTAWQKHCKAVDAYNLWVQDKVEPLLAGIKKGKKDDREYAWKELKHEAACNEVYLSTSNEITGYDRKRRAREVKRVKNENFPFLQYETELFDVRHNIMLQEALNLGRYKSFAQMRRAGDRFEILSFIVIAVVEIVILSPLFIMWLMVKL